MIKRRENVELGIVVPCYNEEDVLPALTDRLAALAKSAPLPLWFLFVNDGSRDRTAELLEESCVRHPCFACVHLSRNFGHQTAVSAGLQHVRGDVVGVIDADLQDPPEILLAMLERWREGFDVVYGVRQNRKEGLLLRTAYAAFYRLQKKVANVDLPLDAGDFCIMDRRVVDLINSMPEHNRFVRGLRGWVGFRQCGFPYDRAARAAGEAKYNLTRLFKLAFDGLVSFSSAPLRLATYLGFFAATIGIFYLLFAIAVKFTHPTAPIGWTSTIALVTFFGGVQLLMLGIVGEYLGRIFEEVKRRPLYVVSRRGGWLEDGKDGTP